MTSKLPHFLYHREARCFRCNGLLLDLSPTRNAPGHGHYRGKCPNCSARLGLGPHVGPNYDAKTGEVFTWYDCAEGTVELIDLNESRSRAQF